MKTLVVSGIWPPDVGGPASHAPEVAAFLRGRGHEVEVVTTARSAPAAEEYAVHWVSRGLPAGVRHAWTAVLIARRAAAADVVYTTGMLGRSTAGAALVRTPLVVKLTADPAYERARRRGLFTGSLDEFQGGEGGARASALRAARTAELQRAANVLCPSDYLLRLALGWGLAPDRVSVLPNAMPTLPELPEREELRRRLGMNGATLVFAGRLTRQKALGVALAALTRSAGPSLLIAGDGDERGTLEQQVAALGLSGRVSFLGAQRRERVLELLYAADLCLLSSTWENFPHTVVESLAVGTPVLATAVGGVPEVVRDGENGLLVPPGDPVALAAALERYFSDAGLQARLRAAAPASVAAYAADRILARLEGVLRRAAERA